MLQKIKNLRDVFLRIDSRTIYLYSFVVGCITGVVAILFYQSIHFLTDLFFNQWAHLPLASSESPLRALATGRLHPRNFLVLILPALGGLIVGLITKYWAPEAKGTGIDLLLDSFHNQSGQMRRRTPFAKFFASALTLSTGGSAGKEGPMSLIGAGIGTLVGSWVKMGARAKRTLLLAGSAGGLGAIFRAPLGGAITAVEVLYKEDFEADALLPCIIASVTAYTIFSSSIGFGHILALETKMFHAPLQLIFYLGLGLFCSGAGYLFIWMFQKSKKKIFDPLPIPSFLKPALGGLLVGIVALFMPQAIGEGTDVIQNVINGQFPHTWIPAGLFLLTLALLKMFTTSATVQSGGSGGVLVPCLFIGAMLGGFFGKLCHHFFPNIVTDITPFMVVGMASFFSAVTNASLGAIVMVTEMTGGYELLPPLMLVGVISLILSRKWSIYPNQVSNKFSSQAHLYDMNPMNLIPIKIGEAFRQNYHHRAIVPEDRTLAEIEALTQQTHATDYIIASKDHALLGLFTLRDLTLDQEFKTPRPVVPARDLIRRPLYYVTEEDSLYQALKLLMDTDFDKVPVVRKEDQVLRLLGYVRHLDILEFYYRMGLQHLPRTPHPKAL